MNKVEADLWQEEPIKSERNMGEKKRKSDFPEISLP